MRPAFTGRYAPARHARADVFLPDLPGPHPVVALVHGGTFGLGSRRQRAVRHLVALLLDAGFAAVAFDHRTLLRGGGFRVAVDDTRALLAWVADRAGSFGLDRDRVAVVGIGGGAAVAAVAADDPWRLACFYGPHDFALRPIGPLARLLLGDADPQRLAWRSPVNACRAPGPLLVAHGTHDRLVPVAHAERLVAARRGLGLPVRLRLFAGAGHGFLDHDGMPLWDEAAGELLAFLLEPADK